MKKIKTPAIFISHEVLDAIKKNKPVVALESTIISHGMPYPKNVETALELEKICREEGCVPATIAIMDGNIEVGLSPEQIEKISNGSTEVIKVSKRDIPICTARKLCGATTVASTMYIANLAGINVFATGGVGGVHRDQASVMDISCDLEEFGKSNVIVVSSGIKSILDIPNTLEYFETLGVPVLGYQTKDMPAFYTSKSGVMLDYEAKDAKDIANIFHDKMALNIEGGMLICNPIEEKYEIDRESINKSIETALEDAKKDKITGKRITPYLLKRIVEITGGLSLEANIALAKNNVRLACKIAKEIAYYEED